jgi:hypothetical protein
MNIEERKQQMREELEALKKLKDAKNEFKEKLNSSPAIATESAKYLGGHPLLMKEADGIARITKIGLFFEVMLTVNKFYIPAESILKAEFKNEEQISKDVTLTRLLALGIFAFALKKKTSIHINFLTVTYITEEGIENTIVFQTKNAGALASAIMKIRQEKATGMPQLSPVENAVDSPANNDIPAQIRKLAELKNDGILSEAEFEQKKAELLARI